MIDFANVTKSFAGKAALRDLSLKIARGKTTVLLGTSGCGKSTILRLIVGLIAPDAGRIVVDDETLTPASLATLRQRIGYVIQDGGLFPHLTAAQNVTIMAEHLKWPVSEQRSRLEELARLTNLDLPLLDKYPHQLSGGQRQRVGLMRGLMLKPELLLLDEPLGALDPITRSDLQRDLKDVLKAMDKTAILVTHDLGEAFYLGDVIVLLHDGEIVQIGTAADLVERPATPFVTRFVNAQRPPALTSELSMGGQA